MLRSAAGSLAAVLLCFAVAAAQVPTERVLDGTVVLSGEPVDDVPVTLHRVTADASGPLATERTAGDGSFRFVLPAADSASSFEVFFVTAEYLSVRYFGPAVHGGVVPESYAVAVHDTASSLPGAIEVARRDIVLLPETQGGWEANEIIRLRNTADRTLVSAGGMPTWEMQLPEGITDFEAGEGDATAAEFARMGDRVMFLSSIIPGDRELFLRYRIPAELERFTLPIETPTDTLHLFLAQPSVPVEVAGLQTTNVIEVQGQQFVRYGTADLQAGAEVGLTWDAPAGPPLPPEIAGGVAAAIVLLGGSWLAFRARGRRGEEPAPTGAA